MAIPNVAPALQQGNCCPSCGAKKAWSYRQRPEKPADCGPVVLTLSPIAAHDRQMRKDLWEHVVQTQLPQERASTQILNMPAAKLQEYLSGKDIPKHTEDHIKAIESVQRSGPYVTVVYNVGQISSRWNAMQQQRQLRPEVEETEQTLKTWTKAYTKRRKQRAQFASCGPIANLLP